MQSKPSKFPFFALLIAVTLLLTGCEMGSTKGKSPYRAPASKNASVTPAVSSVEVATSFSVAVAVKDKGGYGVPGVVPSVSASKSVTGSTGVTSGGCSITDRLGNTTCTLSATLPGVYTVSVTSPVQMSASSTVTVVQYPRTLTFSTQPSAAAVSVTDLAQQPVVTVRDKAGNVMPSAGNVTLSLTSATSTSGGTAVLGVTTNPVATSVAGLATFAGVDIDLIGSYTLTATLTHATSGTLTATSTAIAITAGAAARLRFSVQPSSSMASGVAFTQAPIVGMADAQGNEVTTNIAGCTVALTMTGGEAGDTLNASLLTLSTVSSYANFAGQNLRVVRAATTTGPLNYNLVATAGGLCAALTAATSSSFQITLAGMPAQLAVVQVPSTAALNETWLSQPVVQVLDVDGNPVTTDNTTVVTITKDAASPAGVLSGSTVIQMQSGRATFSGLSIPATTAQAAFAGTYLWDFTAVATTPLAVTGINNLTQTITQNGLVPAALQFRIQPTNKARNQPNVDIEVRVVDSNGYFCFNENAADVQLEFISGTGLAYQSGFPLPQGGGTITADMPVINGVATFTGLHFDTVGAKMIRAQDPLAVLTAVNSNSFAISSYAGTADHLSFVAANGGQQPADTVTTPGLPWTTQPKVAVNDVYGNLMTNDNTTVITISCIQTIACALLGTTTATVINGVATFTDLRMGVATAGIVLSATGVATPTALPVTTTQSFPAFSED